MLPGRVERLHAPVLPHMGWNTVVPPQDSVLFAGLDADTRFYFVHSYAAHDYRAGRRRAPSTVSRSSSAVERGPVSATQFHPEKSGDAGATLLENWLASLTL